MQGIFFPQKFYNLHLTPDMDNASISVILVDDDLDDQFFFKEGLRHMEHSIHLTVASSSAEALNLLLSCSPSIIFLDINMPGQSGKECLKTIRNNKEYDHITVIMFTTSSSEEDIDECFANGANLYVIKPLSTIEQTNMLNRIFSLYKSRELIQPGKQHFVFNLYA
jgi:CheY-like chemotaxis protein